MERGLIALVLVLACVVVQARVARDTEETHNAIKSTLAARVGVHAETGEHVEQRVGALAGRSFLEDMVERAVDEGDDGDVPDEGSDGAEDSEDSEEGSNIDEVEESAEEDLDSDEGKSEEATDKTSGKAEDKAEASSKGKETPTPLNKDEALDENKRGSGANERPTPLIKEEAVDENKRGSGAKPHEEDGARPTPTVKEVKKSAESDREEPTPLDKTQTTKADAKQKDNTEDSQNSERPQRCVPSGPGSCTVKFPEGAIQWTARTVEPQVNSAQQKQAQEREQEAKGWQEGKSKVEQGVAKAVQGLQGIVSDESDGSLPAQQAAALKTALQLLERTNAGITNLFQRV